MFVFSWKIKEFTSEVDFHLNGLELQAATLSVKIYRVLMDELTYIICLKSLGLILNV